MQGNGNAPMWAYRPVPQRSEMHQNRTVMGSPANAGLPVEGLPGGPAGAGVVSPHGMQPQGYGPTEFGSQMRWHAGIDDAYAKGMTAPAALGLGGGLYALAQGDIVDAILFGLMGASAAGSSWANAESAVDRNSKAAAIDGLIGKSRGGSAALGMRGAVPNRQIGPDTYGALVRALAD